MLAPLFLFAALASAEPTPKLRLTVVAVSAAAPEIERIVGARLRYETELQVARTLESELSLREVRVVSEGTATAWCAGDTSDYVLTVQAVTGFEPGPTPGIVPSGTGTIRLIASGTAAVTAQLVRCPGTLAAQAIASEIWPRGVSSMSELFNAFANEVAYRIVDEVRPPSAAKPATEAAAKPRISIIASNLNGGDMKTDMAVAEQRIVDTIESGFSLTEVARVSDGSVRSLCAGNATDYVLSVEAALAPDYQIMRTTPPTFPGPVPTFLTLGDPVPQVSAALLSCPGTLLATSSRHAWPTNAPSADPLGGQRFSSIAQSVADAILAQIPIPRMSTKRTLSPVQIPANHS